MDQDKQKPAEVTSEAEKVETPQLEDSDLDVVTGGLISRGGAGAADDGGCITAAP